MSLVTKNKILIWIIVVLLATNISTVATIWFSNSNTLSATNISEKSREQERKIGRYFIEELNLSHKQRQQFRDLRHAYRDNMKEIKQILHQKRSDLLLEMKKENADSAKLLQISQEIGLLHKNIKIETFQYYLKMKNLCDTRQQKKLYDIFEKLQSPHRHHGRHGKNHH